MALQTALHRRRPRILPTDGNREWIEGGSGNPAYGRLDSRLFTDHYNSVRRHEGGSTNHRHFGFRTRLYPGRAFLFAVGTPAAALGFGNPGASSLGLRTGRQTKSGSAQGYLAERLAEELIAELARFKKLHVVSRSASFAFSRAGVAWPHGPRHPSRPRRRGDRMRRSEVHYVQRR